jgi:hypothetical protein
VPGYDHTVPPGHFATALTISKIGSKGVSQQFLTDLELGPFGWRGLWVGNR